MIETVNRVIRVDFESGKTGRVYATSPDIRGLLLGRESKEECMKILPQAITDMLTAQGEENFTITLIPRKTLWQRIISFCRQPD